MSMIERAARASFEAVQADGAGFRDPWDHPSMERVRKTYLVAMRAALSSIREPFQSFDDPIAIAGGEILGVGKSPPLHWSSFDEAKRVWQAMIDAALAEGGAI